MKFHDYDEVVIIAERASGNETIGTVWFDTKTFPKSTTLEEVVCWAEKNGCEGKLVISINKRREGVENETRK